MTAVFKKISVEQPHTLMLGDVIDLLNPDWGTWVVVSVEPDMDRPWKVTLLGDDVDDAKDLSPTCEIVTLRRVKV